MWRPPASAGGVSAIGGAAQAEHEAQALRIAMRDLSAGCRGGHELWPALHALHRRDWRKFAQSWAALRREGQPPAALLETAAERSEGGAEGDAFAVALAIELCRFLVIKHRGCGRGALLRPSPLVEWAWRALLLVPEDYLGVSRCVVGAPTPVLAHELRLPGDDAAEDEGYLLALRDYAEVYQLEPPPGFWPAGGSSPSEPPSDPPSKPPSEPPPKRRRAGEPA